MRDGSMSNGVKSRLGAQDVGKLTFNVHVPAAGRYTLAVNYTGIGFDSTPRLAVNGTAVTGSVISATCISTTPIQDARFLKWLPALKAFKSPL